MSDPTYICGKCEQVCECVEIRHGDLMEVWGAPTMRYTYEDLSDCCEDDCYTVEEWRENGWEVPQEVLEYLGEQP